MAFSPPGHVLSSRGIFSEGALKEKRKTCFKRTLISQFEVIFSPI